MDYNLNRNYLLLKTSRLQVGILSLILIAGFTSPVFADSSSGENEGYTPRNISNPQDLLPVGGSAPTFFGNGGVSTDGCGSNPSPCTLQAEVPAGSTVVSAWLYAANNFLACPATVDVTLDATPYVLAELTHNTFSAFNLCSYRADVTSQVAATVGAGGGITAFTSTEGAPGTDTIDGTALVVVYSNPTEPETSVIVLDGGLDSAGQQTIVGLAAPLDKTIPGFTATMALGINFGNQGVGPGTDQCGTTQVSEIDINGQRLTSCAGNADDGPLAFTGGALFTVGGVGDSTNNPANPFATGTGFDDELYDLEPFLTQGDTQIVIDTVNPSDDDNIFLAVFALSAQASLEICDNGIDDDGDGLIDLADPDCQVDSGVVGGEFLPIETTSLILAGAQSFSWTIPLVLSIVGIGIFVVSRKIE